MIVFLALAHLKRCGRWSEARHQNVPEGKQNGVNTHKRREPPRGVHFMSDGHAASKTKSAATTAAFRILRNYVRAWTQGVGGKISAGRARVGVSLVIR